MNQTFTIFEGENIKIEEIAKNYNYFAIRSVNSGGRKNSYTIYEYIVYRDGDVHTYTIDKGSDWQCNGYYMHIYEDVMTLEKFLENKNKEGTMIYSTLDDESEKNIKKYKYGGHPCFFSKGGLIGVDEWLAIKFQISGY